MNRKSLALTGLLLLACSCRSMPNAYGPRMLDSGLTIQEIVVPDGPIAQVGDHVKIHYHGTLPDGLIFDSSVERGQPISFTLGVGEVPQGLDQGVLGMHLFGRRKLIAPIALMFPSGVPPHLDEVTRVDLVIELLELTAAE